jgi:hypothetical protein
MVAACFVILVLTGCTRTPSAPAESVPAVADAYRAQIDQLLAGDELGDQQRAVLADYWVTDEEYAQARDPVPACMAERGFDATLLADGGVDVAADDAFWDGRDLGDQEVSDAADDAMNECQQPLMWIESLYWDMRNNPQNWDYWEAMQLCAQRLGLPEGDLSTEELKAASLESDDFLSECRSDPWSLAQGREPAGGPVVEP